MIEELKKEYNKLIKRQKDAIKYFESIEDQEKLNKELKRLFPTYDKVVVDLHEIRKRIECFGYKLSNEEVMEGFEIDE